MKKKIAAVFIVVSLIIVSALALTGCDDETSKTIDDVLDIIDQLTSTDSPDSTDGGDETSVPADSDTTPEPEATPSGSSVLDQIPEYSGNPWVVLNNNKPLFTDAEITTDSYEFYSDLDSLGRCQYAMACIGADLMPTESRGNISSVKPTAWHSVQYDFIDDGSLYNRCHLIAYKLTGENANALNLITGTRYLNNTGMTLFEEKVYDYVKNSENHVMYRVTPIFDGSNLLASGLTIEGYSVEDKGASICFYVYCYNVQPGVNLDYKTGDSSAAASVPDYGKTTYYVNLTSYKFHIVSCDSVASMYESNTLEIAIDIDLLLEQGCKKCSSCQ